MMNLASLQEKEGEDVIVLMNTLTLSAVNGRRGLLASEEEAQKVKSWVSDCNVICF